MRKNSKITVYGLEGFIEIWARFHRLPWLRCRLQTGLPLLPPCAVYTFRVPILFPYMWNQKLIQAGPVWVSCSEDNCATLFLTPDASMYM